MKTFHLLAFMLVISANTMACDVCSFYLGIHPNDRQNSLTLMFRNRFLSGDILPAGSVKHAGHGDTPLIYGNYKEIYNVYELRGRYYVSDRFFLRGVLPYVNNYRSVNGTTQFDVYGLGDPSAMGNFQLFNTKCLGDSIKFRHRMVVGTGVKFPLGSTGVMVDEVNPDLDMQPGTGSWDLLFSMEYMLRINKTGINSNVIYKLNNANEQSFEYGDASTARVDLFHLFELMKSTVMPSIGGYYEHAGIDEENSQLVNGTGGDAAFVTAGLKVFFKNISVHASYQKAVYNNVGVLQVPNNSRTIIGATYNFN